MQVISPKYGRRTMYPAPPIQAPKNNGKRKIFFTLVLVAISYTGYRSFFRAEKNFERGSQGEVLSAQSSEAFQQASFQKEDAVAPKDDAKLCKIEKGDTPAKIFNEHGKLDANDTEAILAASEGVYDFTGVRIGRDMRFYFDGQERATRIEYDRDTERTVVVERAGEEFKVHEEKIPYEVSVETARGKIDNFFYADALEAGLSEPTVLEVGDLFSFSIDFMTDIRQGDEFGFVYEKRKRNGQDAPDGRILAAKFINDGTAHYAYYFEKDGEGGYYDEEGRVLERQFLKAPLSFSRITSGYTGARMHPITKTVTAHYQIDYAAPTGTPVVSTARGTVTSARFETGWGNIVRISHDNGYTTHYGHLSAFAKDVTAGTRVSQGEVVGYVGSTGWSTGPHLDFGMKLDGAPINPLKLDLPKGSPLDEAKISAFNETRDKYSQFLK
ncbi:MAG TPA: hypothetical protein DCX32_04190 [Candidatus Moranbacteria bacterium]|nr:MAG: Peptidase M23 [Candidatus Moranbacteria bacterium GW2011_GWC2_45_10]KKT93062.1 MAG: metalloendopeptidase-like protein membrane protein [Parcubacteria group bacterium GW2011_GWC1_45_14]HAV11707.1 hypothetical protein [Candidatus Moranbacteria bacterium]